MRKNIDKLLQYINFDGKPTSWYNLAYEIEKNYNSNFLDKYDFDEILKFYSFDTDFKIRVY